MKKYQIIVTDASNMLRSIRLVREHCGLGLVEARAFMNSGYKFDENEASTVLDLGAKLEAIGDKVLIRDLDGGT